MSSIGSFGKRRETMPSNDSINVCGEELALRPGGVDGYTMMMHLVRKIDCERGQAAILRAIEAEKREFSPQEADQIAQYTHDLITMRMDFIGKAMAPDAHERLVELIEINGVDVFGVAEIYEALYAWASARPTMPPSESSDGRKKIGTKSNSTFSELSKELNEEDTSESQD